MKSQKKKPNKTVPRPVAAPAIPPADKLKVLKRNLALLSAVFAFVLYANTLNHGYALDDFPTIKGNKLTQQGLEGIPTLAKTAYWYGLDGQNDWLYRPLSMVMFAVEWEFFPDNPAAGHFVNVMLYALTIYLLFLLLSEMLAGYNFVVPFVTTLLFAAHPLHTEVVANIKSRDEILWLLLFIIATRKLLEHHRTGKILPVIMAGICYFLALFAKESAITLLAVFPLVLFYFTGMTLKRNAVIALSFGLAAAVYLYIRGSVLTTQTGGAETTIPIIDNTLRAAPDLISRQATAFYILGKYIWLLLFPHPLAYDYSFAQIPLVTFSNPGALLALIIYLFMGVYALMRFTKREIIPFGILFYLIPLSLVANVLFLTRSTMAERFLYLPSLGFTLIVALLLARWTKAEITRQKFTAVGEMLRSSSGLFTLVAVILLPYSAKTMTRNLDWENDYSLFSHDLDVVPRSARAQFLYANHLIQSLNQGIVPEEKKEMYWNESVKGFQKAFELYPQYYDARFGLGEAYSWKKEYTLALAAYKNAALYGPSNPTVYNNIGNTFYRIGQLDSAVHYLQTALKVKPDFADPYNNMGAIYFAKGEYEKAVENYKKALEINPQYSDAWRNLGSTFGTMKDYDKAIDAFQKAINHDPRNPDNYQYMGLTWQFKGDTVVAKGYLQKAADLRQGR